MSEQRHVLHWSFRSPFVKRVLLAADELGATSYLEHVRSVVPTDNHQHPIVEGNPLGKSPTLVSPSGEKVHGLSLILEYFDWLVESGEWQSEYKLFPGEPLSRLRVRQIEVVCDEVLQILLAWMMEWYIPTVRSRAKYANSNQKIQGSLDFLNRELDWLVDSGINAASINMACTLSYLDFRFSRIIDWRINRGDFAAWHEEPSQRQLTRNNPFLEG